MQQVSSPAFNQNGRSQKKKTESERGNPQRRSEDLKPENMLKEEEDQIYQMKVAQH